MVEDSNMIETRGIEVAERYLALKEMERKEERSMKVLIVVTLTAVLGFISCALVRVCCFNNFLEGGNMSPKIPVVIIFILILGWFVAWACEFINVQNEVNYLKTELAACEENRRPKGAVIRLNNGEEVVIYGNGSFRMKTSTVAHIRYIYGNEELGDDTIDR